MLMGMGIQKDTVCNLEVFVDIVYDIETYKNVFTLSAVFTNGSGMRTFEISDRKNECEQMIDFLRNVNKHKMKMIGFNNNSFDYPVLHHILLQSKQSNRIGKPLHITAGDIYDVAYDLIFSENQFRSIRAEEVMIPQIDLFLIHHFNNKARATSLKILEVRMLSDDVEDLPFTPGTSLTNDEIDVLIKYNQHDVWQTLKFYNKSIGAIEFRNDLTKKYGFDCTNLNDTAIGKQYFIHQLEKAIPGSCYKVVGNRRVIQQTKRDKIVLKEILFDYLKYSRPEFQAIRDWFSKQVITETKGVFSDILEHNLGDVAKYADMVVKKKKLSNPDDPKDKNWIITQDVIDDMKSQYPLGWLEEKELKSPKGSKSYYWCWNVAETLNVVVNGFRYDYGTGGIHGCISPQIVESDDNHIIVDADVTSLYPSIAIVNRCYPKHLTEKFCDIYEKVFETRKSFPKGTPENAVMKLALNGTYGETNNQYSCFYDPQYTMQITIGGQSLISMLADAFTHIDGLEMIQANTDGITVRIPRNKRSQYDQICKDWEKITSLNLEFAEYDKMVVRDVNNYIAVYKGGEKLKRKGAYEYDGLGWHQNQSALVIRKAVEHELFGRGSVEEFINTHDNKWDFLLATKVPRSSKLVLVVDGVDIPQQNVCRYYPSPDGGSLVKIMPPIKDGGEDRRIGIDTDYLVKICNHIDQFDWDVDYKYYINEARKLIDVVKW